MLLAYLAVHMPEYYFIQFLADFHDLLPGTGFNDLVEFLSYLF